MTIHDLRCDVCGVTIGVPGDGIRFVYHPGKPLLRDTSGLMCRPCWADTHHKVTNTPEPRQCAVCGQSITRLSSLHVRRFDDTHSRQLCAAHAVEFLNRLRTVQPKIDPATFRFPFAHPGPDTGTDPGTGTGTAEA